MARQQRALTAAFLGSALLHAALLGLLPGTTHPPASSTGGHGLTATLVRRSGDLPLVTASEEPPTVPPATDPPAVGATQNRATVARPAEAPPPLEPAPTPRSERPVPRRTTPTPVRASRKTSATPRRETATPIRSQRSTIETRPVAAEEASDEKRPRPAAALYAPASGPGDQLRTRIQRHLASRLSERFRYPLLARRRGWQGVVRLRFLVRANGEIADVQLAATSGFRLLDRDALKTARELRRLPDHLVWRGGQTLTLELPVRYRLQG